LKESIYRGKGGRERNKRAHLSFRSWDRQTFTSNRPSRILFSQIQSTTLQLTCSSPYILVGTATVSPLLPRREPNNALLLLHGFNLLFHFDFDLIAGSIFNSWLDFLRSSELLFRFLPNNHHHETSIPSLSVNFPPPSVSLSLFDLSRWRRSTSPTILQVRLLYHFPSSHSPKGNARYLLQLFLLLV